MKVKFGTFIYFKSYGEQVGVNLTNPILYGLLALII